MRNETIVDTIAIIVIGVLTGYALYLGHDTALLSIALWFNL